MAATILDQAGEVREGEALNPQAIIDYMRAKGLAVEDELTITQFPGGASNLTYLLQFPEREYILRRPPFGTKAKSAHDMSREYKVMSRLKPVFPFVPQMVAFCDDEQVLGCEFYLMERLVGVIPRADLPAGMKLTADQAHKLCCNAIDCLVDLHNVDYQAEGLSDLGKGEGYVIRQIEGWSQRFVNAKTDDVPDCEMIMTWLHANMPDQVKVCVIHNDYRLDNVVLNPEQPTEIIGVLDWEMATLGDPLMDLGNSLAYWVEAGDPPAQQMMRRQPTHLPGMMSRDEVVAYYCKQAGLDSDDFLFYRIYGLFRLAVIVQQIYYRYYHGQTRDQRFSSFGVLVAMLENQCRDLLVDAGAL